MMGRGLKRFGLFLDEGVESFCLCSGEARPDSLLGVALEYRAGLRVRVFEM